jgi:VWFA-related protein
MTVAVLTALATIVSGQTPAPSSGQNQPPKPATAPAQPTQQTQTPAQQTPIFRAGTDVFRIDVYPRDNKGQFVPNLKSSDFQIFEDGVEQKIQNFTYVNGGRHFSELATTSARPTEGLILPKAAPPRDESGRIFIIFVDDLHFMPGQTPEVKKLMQLVRDTLVHDTDLVGFVSSGFSSIEIDPAYDPGHRRFNEAIDKVMGSGPTIKDMINMDPGSDGFAELNHNVGVAFSAAYNLLQQMEEIHDKRKAFVWISNGYQLDPFKDSRLARELQKYASVGACDDQPAGDPSVQVGPEDINRNDPCHYINTNIDLMQNARIGQESGGFGLMNNATTQWKNADLMVQLAELIRAANRANVMFFPLDPRGLISSLSNASMSQQLSHVEESEFMMGTIGTLRALADNTGGVACVNTNDCRPVLQKIDNMTSDYYMIGYTSTNPDPFKVTRKIEIRVKRSDVEVVAGRDYKANYYLKRPKDEKKK